MQFAAKALRTFVHSLLFVYIGLIILSTLLDASRLSDSAAMPGLGAIELVLLALPWCLSLGVEPISRLGLYGMFIVMLAGLVLNLFLLRSLARLLDTRTHPVR